MQYIRTFATRHDQLPAFHATYLVLTALIAALLPLGAFALLIVAHMALDTVKYREIAEFRWSRVVSATLRESLVDVTLFTIGLLFAVYLHHSLPLIASLSGLYRAQVTIARAVSTFVPKVKILGHVLGVMSHLQEYLATVAKRPRRFEPLEQVSLFSLSVAIVLLALAPSALGLDAPHFWAILTSELVPWNI